jgi:hypothetical protein
MAKIIRRSWGYWQLYTSRPKTLGISPYNHFVYHVPLKDLQTQAGRNRWFEHLGEKGYNLDHFKLAVKELIEDETIKTED